MMGKTYKFCPLCSAELVEKRIELENRKRLRCPSCDFIYYQNPTPAAGIVLIEDGRVLMVKRKYPPRVDMWTLPAGFVESGEDTGACAIREAKEETNLDVDITRIFSVYSAFDDPRASVVLVMYLTRKVGGELECGDDASDARFFPLDELPDNIAFRAHEAALADIKRQHADGML